MKGVRAVSYSFCSVKLSVAYIAYAMVDVDEEERVSFKSNVILWVAAADYRVLVIVQFLKLAWAWSSEPLKSMPNFDPWVFESCRSVNLSKLHAVIDSLRHVGVNRIVSRTRYSAAHALAAVVCACSNNWTRPHVAGWYPYDFRTGTCLQFLRVVPGRERRA